MPSELGPCLEALLQLLFLVRICKPHERRKGRKAKAQQVRPTTPVQALRKDHSYRFACAAVLIRGTLGRDATDGMHQDRQGRLNLLAV